MKILALTVAILAMGWAITNIRSPPDRPSDTSSPPSQQRTQPQNDLGIPALASRTVLYSSGVPNGKFRAIAVDDGWNLDCYLVEVASKKIRFDFSGPAKGAYYAEISPQETYLASSRIFDKKIAIWAIETGEIAIELEGHEAFTCALTFSPDESKLASLSVDGEVNVWDIGNQKVIASQQLPPEQFESFQFDSNETLSIRLTDGLQTINLP